MTYTSVSVVALVGQIQDVRAAVFEQRCSGKVIAIAGGAPAGAPPRKDTISSGDQAVVATSVLEFGPSAGAVTPEVPAGDVLAADPAPLSPACPNPPAGTQGRSMRALRTLKDGLSLPAPKRLSQNLSGKQQEMRELTADIALRFAGEPGVRKANLDKATFIKMFTTLVHQESHFHPRAVSPVGARGLGQLMPGTARHLGVKDPFAPEQNLVGAATYLTEMLEIFGSPELALAAYNAGPTAVKKYGSIPPYRETRQYVANILHEVLRDPAPTYVTARANTLPSVSPSLEVIVGADIPSAAKSGGTQPSQVRGAQFASIITENREKETDGLKPQVLAFAAIAPVEVGSDDGAREAAFRAGQQAALEKGTDQNPRSEMAGNEEKLPLPSLAPLPAARPVAAVPMPDLTLLPAPRPFSGKLRKSQVALRDLANKIALSHAQAPGVGKAGLSGPEFAALFVALIRRESSFNRRAVSTDGSKGLGQLKPQILREMGVKDPFSAQENLDAAATHLAMLLERLASPALALAAYDAGLDKVLEKGGIPDVRLTRQFVADVLHDTKSDSRSGFLKDRPNESGPERPGSDEVPAGTGPVIGAFLTALAIFLTSIAGALFGRPQHQPVRKPNPVVILGND